MWGFPKIVVPQNGWFIRKNPIKMDDLGVPTFKETTMYNDGWKTTFLLKWPLFTSHMFVLEGSLPYGFTEIIYPWQTLFFLKSSIQDHAELDAQRATFFILNKFH